MRAEDVVVVIPCLNEEAHLPGLIEQLLADGEASGATIVVADGGSTDRSRQIVADFAARTPRVRLMDNPKRLQSAGINLAAAEAGEDARWLVRIDAHAGYPATYVSDLVKTARAIDAGSVVVSMRAVGRSCFSTAAATAQNSRLGTGGSAHRHSSAGDWVDHGHHALFDLTDFRALGGYDEAFSHNEDAEYDTRLAARGRRVWLMGGAGIDYYPRSSPGALFRQYRKYGQGRARTMIKHRAQPKLRQILPVGVAPAVALALLTPLWWPLALPATIWAAAALIWGLCLGVRAGSACAALSGVAAMTMHVAWSIGFIGEVALGRRPAR